jgi:hypothetical protein
MDDLISHLRGSECETWALRAEDFPEKLIPRGSKDYLCYMGISADKLETTYGQVHFIEYGYEAIADNVQIDTGMLEHMYDIYIERTTAETFTPEDGKCIKLFPKRISSEGLEYWCSIAENEWGIKDKKDFDDFIRVNEIYDHVDWECLREYTPDVYYPSDWEYYDSESSDDETETETETETESETEEGEIVEEPLPKRRRILLSDSE